MAKRIWTVVFIAAWATGLSLLATPSISQADTLTVTEIKVRVGGATFCGSTVAADCTGTFNIWTSALGGVGGAGISLTDGQSLVFTQTGGTFSFDSSDNPGAADHCTAALPCTTSLEINHAAVAIPAAEALNSILANQNQDVSGSSSASLTHNEARNWSQVGGVGPDSQVYFGYADNLHTDACADGGNCLPSVGGTVPTSLFADATFFVGAPASGAGLNVPPGGASHCDPNNTAAPLTCFDAGAIMIFNVSAVPEPSSFILAATVLVGLAGMAWRKRLYQ